MPAPQNPYRPPAYDEDPQLQVPIESAGLASLGARFVARLIDNMLMAVGGLAGLFLFDKFDDFEMTTSAGSASS